MKMDGAAPFLPEEIIRNILKRLPVKSLTRFRCVCKHWKNLFKSPSFIADHLHYSNRQNPSLLFQPKREGQYVSQLYVLDRGMQVRELPSVPVFGASRFRVVGSSNGLLCVEIDVQGINPPPLLLFNPATRDVIKLPRTVEDFECECHLGFGFSPIVNDYKIVRTYAEPRDCIYRVEVYSLSTRSWEDDEYYQMPGAIFFADAITANGSMFWIGLQLDLDTDEEETDLDMDGDKPRVIFSFDIASEEFDRVPIPALGNNSLYQLMVYEDTLAILAHVMDAEPGCMFDLWVMEEHMDASDGERRSWTKISSRTYSAVDFLLPSIFWRSELAYNISELPGLLGETECEAENGLSTSFFLLTISTGEVKIFNTRSCGDHTARIFNYEESLVPVSATMVNLSEAHSRLGLGVGGRASRDDQASTWQPPPPGWVKVNTDGAFSYVGTAVGSGGVLRGEKGNFLQAFIFRGGEGDSLTAELWGCLHGIKMAWDLGFRNVILETDSADAVDMIRNELNEAHADRTLIVEIKGMLARDWNTEVHHIRRWANAPADHLAKSSLSAWPGFHPFTCADMELDRLLVKDIT